MYCNAGPLVSPSLESRWKHCTKLSVFQTWWNPLTDNSLAEMKTHQITIKPSRILKGLQPSRWSTPAWRKRTNISCSWTQIADFFLCQWIRKRCISKGSIGYFVCRENGKVWPKQPRNRAFKDVPTISTNICHEKRHYTQLYRHHLTILFFCLSCICTWIGIYKSWKNRNLCSGTGNNVLRNVKSKTVNFTTVL